MFKLLGVFIVAGLFGESSQQRGHNPYIGRRPPPEQPCDHMQCWTKWFDRDNPSATGDWENLVNLRRENPGEICPEPLHIEVRTVTGISALTTGDVISIMDTTTGFVCINEEQPKGKMCNDYKVRFSCHPPFCGGGVCWTDWFDRDDPSGTGDWEHLPDLRGENPEKICKYPLYVQAVTTNDETPAISIGETFYIYNPSDGFVCRNKDQRDNRCHDYKVRFGCPCNE